MFFSFSFNYVLIIRLLLLGPFLSLGHNKVGGKWEFVPAFKCSVVGRGVFLDTLYVFL